MNRTSRALRSTALFTGFGYAAQALSVIAIPLYLRTIGAEGYGLMVITMSFMGYLNFADAGLSWGSMILIGQAHGRRDRALIGKIVRNSMVLAAGSGLIVIVAAGTLLGVAKQGLRLPMFAGHPEADGLVVLAALQLVVTLQAGVFFNLFQGLQEAYWTALYQGLGRLVSICAMMAVAILYRTVWAVMLAQLLVTAGFGAAGALHGWRRHDWIFGDRKWIDTAQLRLQLRTGLKVFLLQIGRTLTASAPVMAISVVIGPAAVPLYTVPSTLLQIAFMPLNAWNASLQSAYGEAWESGNRSWVISIFRHTLERGLFWGACGSALFLPLAIPFVSVWTAGRLVVPPLMPLAVVVTSFTAWFATAGQYLLSGLNRQRKVAVAEIGCGLLAIGTAALAVRWLGPAGVAVGVLLPAIMTSLRWIVSEIKFHVSPDAFPPWEFLVRVGLVLAVAGGAGSLFIEGLDGGDGMRRLAFFASNATFILVLFCGLSVLLRLKFIAEAWRQLTGGKARSI
jgi:O-antigen/teichoic acid export membrane protein